MSEDKNTNLVDGRGNSLHIGDEIIMPVKMFGDLLMGKIVGYDRGGVLVSSGQKGQLGATVGRVRIIVDINIQVAPEQKQLVGIFRLVNPQAEEIVQKILDSPLTQ
jgi:hypothetical protein